MTLFRRISKIAPLPRLAQLLSVKAPLSSTKLRMTVATAG